MKLRVNAGGRPQAVPSGTYRATLEAIEAGLMPSRFNPAGAPTARFSFALRRGVVEGAEGVRLSVLAGLPLRAGGLSFNERSKFWKVVGILSGETPGDGLLRAVDVDIPGIESLDELPSLIEAPARMEIAVHGKSLIGAEAILIVATERRDGRDVAIVKEVLPSIPM